jgi:hypothetical protein
MSTFGNPVIVSSYYTHFTTVAAAAGRCQCPSEMLPRMLTSLLMNNVLKPFLKNIAITRDHL